MRVLLISTPVTTHLSPMFPMAWALKAAGHDVLVAGQPDIEPIAHSAGLSTWTAGGPFHVREQMAAHLVGTRRPIELGLYRDLNGNWDSVNKVWIDNARYMVRHYLQLARDWGPQLILADPVEFSSRIIGGLLGVPVVVHRWGIDLLGEQAQQLARQALFLTMTDLGLSHLPEPSLIIDPCPPSLQVKEAVPGLSIRHVLSNGAAALPAWALSPAARPRVCLTFGNLTASLNGLSLFRRLITALGDIPELEFILTLERDYRDALEPVPDCVRIVDPVPLDLFLGTCAAVVHHGGAGTFLSACTVGLPQLVLPGFADSFAVGEQIAASGAGISIARVVGQNNPKTIRNSVAAVVQDPGFRQNAEKLAREISGLPTPADVVKRLEDLARGSG
jgi:UDP:flavonoid glycosyltransferase YjiC (YdhE family)